LASDEKADDKGLPVRICFKNFMATLHPEDPFASPEVQIEISNEESKVYSLIKEKDLLKAKEEAPIKIEVSVVLNPSSFSDTGEPETIFYRLEN